MRSRPVSELQVRRVVGNMEVTAELISLNCFSLVMGVEARMDWEVSGCWQLFWAIWLWRKQEIGNNRTIARKPVGDEWGIDYPTTHSTCERPAHIQNQTGKNLLKRKTLNIRKKKRGIVNSWSPQKWEGVKIQGTGINPSLRWEG